MRPYSFKTLVRVQRGVSALVNIYSSMGTNYLEQKQGLEVIYNEPILCSTFCEVLWHNRQQLPETLQTSSRKAQLGLFYVHCPTQTILFVHFAKYTGFFFAHCTQDTLFVCFVSIFTFIHIQINID